MTLAWKLSYEGRVQGVGFRATVRWIAGGYEIIGWIKNLPDGRVEMLVQGEPGEVRDFLQAIRESELAGHIRTVQQEAEPVSTELRGFSVAR